MIPSESAVAKAINACLDFDPSGRIVRQTLNQVVFKQHQESNVPQSKLPEEPKDKGNQCHNNDNEERIRTYMMRVGKITHGFGWN